MQIPVGTRFKVILENPVEKGGFDSKNLPEDTKVNRIKTNKLCSGWDDALDGEEKNGLNNYW